MNYLNTYFVRISGIFLLSALVLGIGTPAFAMDTIYPSDALPPDMIGDLTMPYFKTDSVTLHWTVASPTIDSTASYDIRYSTAPITASNFERTLMPGGTPAIYSYQDVHPNGIDRTYMVTGLTPGTTYYFAIRSKNQNSGWSGISDIPSMTLPTHAPFIFDSNLYFGIKNDQVSELQTFLTEQKIYVGPITGYFGTLTKKAVIAFQIKNNIVPAVGFVGATTRGIIQAMLGANK